jgi:hypothetical protein
MYLLAAWNAVLTVALIYLYMRTKDAKHICDLRRELSGQWDAIIGRQVLEALSVTQRIERERKS